MTDNILYKNINLKKHNLPDIFINSSSADELVDFINKLLKRKLNERLGSKGINEIIQHSWLKGLDWDTIEAKLFHEKEIYFSPSSGDNFNYLKVNNKINEKDINYYSYLKLINNSTLFNSFYFNSFSINQRKVLSSKNLSHKELCEKNKNGDKIILNVSIKNNRKFLNNDKYSTINESNDSNEYSISEYSCEEDNFIFNKKSDNFKKISGDIKLISKKTLKW